MNNRWLEDRSVNPIIRWTRHLRNFCIPADVTESLRAAGIRVIERNYQWWDDNGKMADLMVEARAEVAQTQPEVSA